MREIAETVLEVFGHGSQLHYAPGAVRQPVDATMDISLARRQIGWTPAYSLRAGLEDFRRIVEAETRRTAGMKGTDDMRTLGEELSETLGLENDGGPFVIAEMSGNHNQSLETARWPSSTPPPRPARTRSSSRPTPPTP